MINIIPREAATLNMIFLRRLQRCSVTWISARAIDMMFVLLAVPLAVEVKAMHMDQALTGCFILRGCLRWIANNTREVASHAPAIDGIERVTKADVKQVDQATLRHHLRRHSHFYKVFCVCQIHIQRQSMPLNCAESFTTPQALVTDCIKQNTYGYGCVQYEMCKASLETSVYFDDIPHKINNAAMLGGAAYTSTS
jgi:hypothetical protein